VHPTPQDLFHELSFYTLSHPDQPYFIHQHSVDAFTAETANESTKPIAIVFALIGLYLYLEKGFTGRQVQLAHMKMAENKKAWPQLPLPAERGSITVADVLRSAAGEPRDSMIRKWCLSVWAAYQNWHSEIANLASTELGVN
jgi:hypothetical protein